MKQIQEMFDEALALLVKEGALDGLSEADIAKVVGEIVPDFISETSSALLKDLRRRAPVMLRQYRADDEGFRRRNHARWRKALDMLEMMWVIAEESGSTVNNAHRAEAVDTQDYRFEALTHLHARGLLVAREVICLLQGGYPDGALSRWRTLHEIAATAMFLLERDHEVSHRYLASIHFNVLRSARQLNEFSKRANLQRYSRKEINEFARRCARLEERFGKEMRYDYGWAAAALNKQQPTFADIEKAVKLDHWRPRYKWASQHTHSGHRPLGTLLGTVESSDPVFLVGQSNSGFTDPIHMTAISLVQLTNAVLFLRLDFEQCVTMKILSQLSEEIGPLALKIEQQTLAKARERDRRQRKANGRRFVARSSRKKKASKAMRRKSSS